MRTSKVRMRTSKVFQDEDIEVLRVPAADVTSAVPTDIPEDGRT